MPPHKVSPDEACAVRHMSCRPREVPAQIHFAEVASSRPVRLQSVVWPAPPCSTYQIHGTSRYITLP